MRREVVIIGGGVLGTTLAYHLSKLRISCVVLEREPVVGAHASGKNAGMMRQLYRHPQLTEWAKRSISSWPAELRESCFTQTGSLVVGRTVPDHHPELFEQRYLPAQTDGNAESLPAVYTATDGLLDSPNYVQRVKQLADPEFAEFKMSQSVSRIEHRPDGWKVETSSGLIVAGEKLVNAAGAWVNSIIAELPAAQVSAQPYARHLFVVRNWERDYMPAPQCGFYWDEHSEWYMRNWDEQSRLVSICEKIPANLPDTFVPDESIKAQVAAKLLSALPEVSARLSIAQSWHCFRTYTEDQLPIWGPDPQLPGFFWLAAFGGFGMSTSYAATDDAARYLAGQAVEVSHDFLPSRVQQMGPLGGAERQRQASC